MIIGTKSQADKVLTGGGSLSRVRWCNGKYKAETSFIGRDIDVPADVRALYMVNGKDSDGAFQRIMAITEGAI